MKATLKDKGSELIGIQAIKGVGFLEFSWGNHQSNSVLRATKVLASNVIAVARSPPVSPGSSMVLGSAAEGVWPGGSAVHRLLERFSGGTGVLPSAWAQVSGMLKVS